MRVSILYRPNSEQSRPVEEFAHEFKRIHDYDVELLSTETREGASIASLYDIMQTPCLMVVENDGHMVQSWSGEKLPLMAEVAAYIVSR